MKEKIIQEINEIEGNKNPGENEVYIMCCSSMAGILCNDNSSEIPTKFELLDALKTIQNGYSAIELSPKEKENLLCYKDSTEQTEHYRVIKEENKTITIGCLSCAYKRVSKIRYIYVIPDYRNQGYGKRMLLSLVALAYSLEYEPYLIVEASNKAMVRAASNIGFIRL